MADKPEKDQTLLTTLYGKVQAEKTRRAEKRKSAATEPIYVGMPRGELIPPSIGRGYIGGGFQKGALSRAGFSGNVVSLQQCRRVARQSPLIQAIHSARLHQAYAFSRRVLDERRDAGWSVIHRDRFNPRRKIDPDWERGIAEKIEAMFERPHPLHERTFSGLFSKFVQDYFTVNRPALQILRNWQGKPVQLVMRNGVELLPTYALTEHYVNATGQDRSALEDEFDRIETGEGPPITSLEDIEYVMVRDGRLVAAFRPGEIFIPQFGPTTELEDFGFAPSHVERAIQAIIAFACSFEYNASYFTRGYMADVIILLAGGYTDMAMQAIEDQMNTRFHGIEGAHKVPIVGVEDLNDAKVLQIKQGNREMEFGTWLQAIVSLTTAVYRMHPSEINFIAMQGNDAPMFERSKTTEIASAKDQGLGVMLGHAAESFTEIVRECHPDFVFHFWNVSPEDEAKAAALRVQEQANYKTLDEIRVANGDKPFGKWWSRMPTNAILLQYAAAENQPQPAAGQVGPDGQPMPGGPQQPGKPGEAEDDGNEIPPFETETDTEERRGGPVPGTPGKSPPGRQQPSPADRGDGEGDPGQLRKGGGASGDLFLLLDDGCPS